MNIAIGKIGRSSYFDKNNWSIYAGDDSPYIIYTTLAKAFPQHNFYMLGGNDLDRIKKSTMSSGFNFKPKNVIDIPNNIIDIYHKAKDLSKKNKTDICDEVINVLNKENIHIDFGIIMQGPDFSVSVPNKGTVHIKDHNKICSVLDMAKNYCAPIIHAINVLKFPYINVNEDPRYVPVSAKDIHHDEEVILSQINVKKPYKRRKGYFGDSKILRDIILNYEYAGIERMFLADKKKVDFSNPDNIIVNGKTLKKSNEFVMALNESEDRMEFLKNNVFKYRPDQIVYGKWNEKTIKGYEKNFECKGIIEMEDLMFQTKFTYVPPFEKRLTNFVTQKVWKMLYYGIIPFWDKKSYDTDNLYHFMPDYFKVSSAKEMWDKIDYLNTHEDEYRKYLKIYYDLLEDKYFNGDFIVETFKPYIERYESRG